MATSCHPKVGLLMSKLFVEERVQREELKLYVQEPSTYENTEILLIIS